MTVHVTCEFTLPNTQHKEKEALYKDEVGTVHLHSYATNSWNAYPGMAIY